MGTSRPEQHTGQGSDAEMLNSLGFSDSFYSKSGVSDAGQSCLREAIGIT